MLMGMVEFPVVVALAYDPAADDQIPLWRAPRKAQIVGAYATVVGDVAAHGTNYFSLQLANGGTAGTATTAISDAVGGVGGWTGLTPKTFTMSAPEVAAGEVVCVLYDENGTGTFTEMTVQLDVRYGD